MRLNGFQDLVVWQQGHELVLKVYKATNVFPEHERFGLVNQVRRSTVSICANIVEGYKKGTKEFLRFLEISQGSLEETKYYLLLSRDLGYCQQIDINEMLKNADDVGCLLNGLIRSLKLSL